MRVLGPRSFDFAALADGVVRNNVGVFGMTLQTDVRVEDGRVVIVATGQSFRLEGPAPADGWAALAVAGWERPGGATLRAID